MLSAVVWLHCIPRIPPPSWSTEVSEITLSTMDSVNEDSDTLFEWIRSNVYDNVLIE